MAFAWTRLPSGPCTASGREMRVLLLPVPIRGAAGGASTCFCLAHTFPCKPVLSITDAVFQCQVES